MRKFTILAAGVAVALAASTARAQGTNNGLAVWYDVRPTSAAILAPVAPFTNGTSVNNGAKTNTVFQVNAGNLGRAGDAAILFMSPELPISPATTLPGQYTKSKLETRNNAEKNLYKYMTVGDRAAGIDEVVGALGLNIDIVKGGAAGEGAILDGVTYAANAALWDGENSSVTDNGGGIDWTIETKAVRVPVAAGPVFDATGATPGVHQVATIGINASDWDKANAVPANSSADNTWTVHDSVNNLLVTRVYNGAGPTPEMPDFGYVTTSAGAPPVFTTGTDEEAAGGDGNTVGTTSVQADATIIVLPIGDFNNNNGVSALDIAGFNTAVAAGAAGTLRQRELYLGNFNNDATVSALDIAGFNGAVAASLGVCPCAP
jgi:hypothetical protein